MNSSVKPTTPDELARVLRPQDVCRCNCGHVVLKKDWPAHWNGCPDGGVNKKPTPAEQIEDLNEFLAYVRYFFGRHQFIPESCLP